MNKWITCLLIPLLLLGCGSNIPSHYEKSLEFSKKSLDRLENENDENPSYYSSLKEDSSWEFLSVYDEKYNWSNSVQVSESDFNHVKNLHDRMEGLLRDDKKSDLKKVEQLYQQTLNATQSLKEKINFIREEPKRLISLSKNFDTKYAESSNIATLASSNKVKLQTLIESSKSKYPDRSEDIDRRAAQIIQDFDILRDTFIELQTIKNSEDLDFKVASNLMDNILTFSKKIKDQYTPLVTSLESLDDEIIKVLTDQRIDYWVQITRYSWDNSSDWDTTNEYQYPAVRVSKDVFDSVKLDEQIQCPKSMIECGENISRWDDSAEYIIEDKYAEYFHKYSVIENGISSETDWITLSDEFESEDVAAQFYVENEQHIGMQVVGKLKGQFFDELSEEPVPPGIEMIGNPEYGQWVEKTDPVTGQTSSFWQLYFQYKTMELLLGGNNYSRYDYDNYRNRDRSNYGYYGNSTSRTWGQRPQGAEPVKRASVTNSNKLSRVGSSYRTSSVRGRGPSGTK